MSNLFSRRLLNKRRRINNAEKRRQVELEDKELILIFDRAYQRFLDDGGKTYTLEEIKKVEHMGNDGNINKNHS